MWTIKRLLCMLLLLSFFATSAFSQEQSLQSTSLWNNIDNSLNFLDNELLFSQTRLRTLEQRLTLSEKALVDKETVCQNLELSLVKSRKDTQKWKNLSVVLGGTTITFGISTAALIMLMRIKW